LIGLLCVLFSASSATAQSAPILSATAGNGQVILNWTQTFRGPGEYDLYRSLTGHSSSRSLIYTTAGSGLNDTDPSITYTGSGWAYYPGHNAGDYKSDVHATTNNGDFASYNFTGTNISYTTETNSNEGNVQIYVDGTLQATVNCYSSTLKTDQTVWSANGLSGSSHVLKLVKQDGQFMLLDVLAFVPSTAYIDTSVTNGTSYDYQIVVHSNYPSTSNTVTVMPTAPAGISLALVAAVNNQASLSWSSVSGTASYNVKRSTTNGSGYTTIANVTSPAYLDQGLTNGTPYYYVVTAVSGTTESAPSNQVAATPTAQAFGFLNAGNGSALSGEVTLYVSMASKAYGSETSPVTFSVDGTVYDTGGDLQQGSGNAGANTTFVLDTDALANGPHTLTVQDTNGNTASVNVTFSNVLYNISIPNMFDASGGDSLPSSAVITANLTSAQPWTVSIVTVDSANSVVQSFSGNSASINVAWDGKNSQGVEVADDAYEVDISYGSQGGTASSSAVSPHGAAQPNGAAQPIIRRNLLSKNKIGDCFVFLDQDVFPSGYGDGFGNMLAYLRAIKADLAPSQGNVWNKFSFVIHGSRQRGWTPSEVQRIDNHFRTRLSVFYVDAHGGLGQYGGCEFFSGAHYWESSSHPFNDTVHHSLMPTLTQSANYGVADPPALVFIDSCDSAGDDPNNGDLSFAGDFDIGDGPSGFLGWGGYAIQYGAKAPPYDDWTFWRLDLWAQFTNVNITFDTAYSNLQRDYNNHGHRAGYDTGNGLRFPDQAMVTDWLSGSAF
jgi:hypothetical protein